MIHIQKFNIYEFPILTVTYGTPTLHCVLDIGATASLISYNKVQDLHLKSWPTVHTAVQVYGISDLKVFCGSH